MKRPISIACLAAAALAALGGCQPTPQRRAAAPVAAPVVAPATPSLAKVVPPPPRRLRAVHRHRRGAHSRHGEPSWLAADAYAGPGPHPYAPPTRSEGYGSSREDSMHSEWSEHSEAYFDESERTVSLRRWTGLNARGYLTWPGKIEPDGDRSRY